MTLHVSKPQDALMTALGIILALTPLAMWVAPNAMVLGIVLAVSITTGFTLWAIAVLTHADIRPGAASLPGRTVLPDQFIAELHKISPLTYHHRNLGDGHYQRRIDRIKKILEP